MLSGLQHKQGEKGEGRGGEEGEGRGGGKGRGRRVGRGWNGGGRGGRRVGKRVVRSVMAAPKDPLQALKGCARRHPLTPS